MKIRCMGCMEEYDSYFDVCPHCGMRKNVLSDSTSGLKPETIINRRYMVGFPLDKDDIGITYIGYDLIDLKRVIVNEYKTVSNEIFSFRRIDVSGIVPVLDVFVERKRQYVITEYVSGKTLEEKLLLKNQMSLDEALTYMLPIMEILVMLHKRGIYHLKVNPNSIFLSDSGEILLMAPGVYQSVIGYHRKKNVSVDEVFYLAPEIKDNLENGDNAADVYSVCAILYRMLTGEIPIKGSDRKNREVLFEGGKKKVVDTRKNSIINGLLSETDLRTRVMDLLIDQMTSIWDVEQVELSEVSVSSLSARENSGSATYKNVGKKGFGKGPLFVGILLITVIIGTFCFMKMSSERPKTLTRKTAQTTGMVVPNLEKSSKEDAENELEKNGMELVVKDTRIDNEKKGTILEQVPERGEKMSGSKQVSVVLSAGKDPITLTEKNIYVIQPESFDTENNSVQNGNISLSTKGYDKLDELSKYFLVSEEEKESYIIPGYVWSITRTEKADGREFVVKTDTKLPDGCALTVTKSKEIDSLSDTQNLQTFNMPDLIGRNFKDAYKKAKKEKFYIGLSDVTEYSMERPGLISNLTLLEKDKDGQFVEGEHIKAGDNLTQGDCILLTLSKGPKEVEVNFSVGEDYTDSLINTLKEDFRLNVETDWEYNDNYGNYPQGTVMKITSTCNHEGWGIDGDLHWGDTVKIIISKGSEPVKTPPQQTRPSTGGSKSSSGNHSTSSSENSTSSNKKNSEEIKPEQKEKIEHDATKQ